MSLQTKFALLLGVIGLSVLLTLSASVWAVHHMQREVRSPFAIMSSALIELQTIKLSIEKQRDLLLNGSPSDEQASPVSDHLPELFEAENLRVAAAMKTMAANEAVVTVTGKTSLANLRIRLSESREISERWLVAPNDQDLAGMLESLEHAFALIRRIEQRIVEDTNRFVMRATDVRGELLWLTSIVGFLILLTCVLGVLLVSRWVMQPVADLRAAAARIAAGDFGHRIPIRATDELGALSTEVNSMAAMVKSMQDEAVQRERLAAVGEVVRRIAHNLRSPLAGIRGLAELTRKELDSPDVPEAFRSDIGENQQRIIGAVDRFELWLRDLLSATRPLEIVHRSLDPAPWLSRVVDAYRPKAQAHGVKVELDTTDAPPLAAFDPRHLELAIGALLSNALDSLAGAPLGSQNPLEIALVRVRCRRIPCRSSEDGQAGEVWELAVEDNGPGVPSDLRERIFTPYFTTKREGTGIGLALAVQVIRAHGGNLTLLNVSHKSGTVGAAAPEARGAVFSARLPIGPIELDPSGVATSSHSESFSGQNFRH